MFHVEHPLANMDVNVPRGTLAKFSEGMGQAKIVFHVEHLFEAGFRGALNYATSSWNSHFCFIYGLSSRRPTNQVGTFLQMAPTCYIFGSIVSDFVAVAFEGLPRTNG